MGATEKQYKKFIKVIFEFDTSETSSLTLYFRPEFDYMNSNVPTPVTSSVTVDAGDLYWDIGNWDEHYWADDGDETPPEAYINGVATEVGLIIWASSATNEPFTLNGVFIEYQMIGRKR